MTPRLRADTTICAARLKIVTIFNATDGDLHETSDGDFGVALTSALHRNRIQYSRCKQVSGSMSRSIEFGAPSSAEPRRHWISRLAAVFLAASGVTTSPALSDGSVAIRVVGGLGAVSQYTQHEAPFWTHRIHELSRGRIQATIHPFDRSGLRGQEMLQLIRLGVVPFGTSILSLVAAEDPELNTADLPALNPDLETLRNTIELYRPHMRTLLAERYGIELIGVYTYPAQVLYCREPFRGLHDLAGRRIRTSSIGQSEMMTALGAVPVQTSFSEILATVSKGSVDCAVTGTLSGNEIGLPEVTTHVHGMAISWGLSFFGANMAVWNSLPADVREHLRGGVAELEARIWAAADHDTRMGILCNIGNAGCRGGRPGRMTLVPTTERDESLRRKLLVEVVLPRWLERCGPQCADGWNERLAAATGLSIGPDKAIRAAGLDVPITTAPH